MHGVDIKGVEDDDRQRKERHELTVELQKASSVSDMVETFAKERKEQLL